MEKKRDFLGTAPVNKLLVKFAVPSIIAMLVSALYNIVDQLFIGQSVGTLGNAATNVAFPLSTSCIAISLMFGIGGAAAFNLAMGRNQKDKAAYYVGNALSFMIGLGILLCIVTQLFLEPMLIFFGSPDNVLEYARTYVSITSIGFPFLILSSGGGNLVRADGSPKFMMFSNMLGALINTVLDAIFILVLDMGMSGAAYATIIGQICSALLVAGYLTRYKTVELKLQHLIPKKEYFGTVISLGTAPCFNQIAMMIVQILMNNSLTHYGKLSVYGESIPLACAGIINKVAMIYFAINIGISQGLQPIISFNYGAEQFDRVKQAFKLAVKSGLIIGICASALFQIFPREIISAFGGGSELYYDFAVQYFRIFMFFTFINFVQPISSNFFTAIGKPKKGIFLSLTRQIIFFVPLLLVLPLVMGIDGIMFAGPIADGAAFITSAIMVRAELKSMSKITTDADKL